MNFDPMLSQMLPNSRVVSLICSREVLYAIFYCLNIVWICCHSLESNLPNLLHLLFRVDDVGHIMALLRWITSCRLQFIIHEDDLESSF